MKCALSRSEFQFHLGTRPTVTLCSISHSLWSSFLITCNPIPVILKSNNKPSLPMSPFLLHPSSRTPVIYHDVIMSRVILVFPRFVVMDTKLWSRESPTSEHVSLPRFNSLCGERLTVHRIPPIKSQSGPLQPMRKPERPDVHYQLMFAANNRRENQHIFARHGVMSGTKIQESQQQELDKMNWRGRESRRELSSRHSYTSV